MPRPRKFPTGTTATERVSVSVAALKAAGGARKTWRLSPEANRALQLIMRVAGAPATETALIERLLLHEEARFLKSPKK
jgi:hypothetical protein